MVSVWILDSWSDGPVLNQNKCPVTFFMMADSEYCMAGLYYQAKRSNKTAYVRHYHGFLSSVIIASTLHMRDVNIRAKKFS